MMGSRIVPPPVFAHPGNTRTSYALNIKHGSTEEPLLCNSEKEEVVISGSISGDFAETDVGGREGFS